MSRNKHSTWKAPDPNSKTSQRRRKRGFQGLIISSRKHRRANNRSLVARTQYGKLLDPGEKVDNGTGTFLHTGGGSLKFW